MSRVVFLLFVVFSIINPVNASKVSLISEVIEAAATKVFKRGLSTKAKSHLVAIADKELHTLLVIGERELKDMVIESLFTVDRLVGRSAADLVTTLVRNPRLRIAVETSSRGGYDIVVERQVGKVIGENGESILRVVIDGSTLAVKSAYPISRVRSRALLIPGMAALIDEADETLKSYYDVHGESTEPGCLSHWGEYLADLVMPLGMGFGEAGADEGERVRVRNFLWENFIAELDTWSAENQQSLQPEDVYTLFDMYLESAFLTQYFN